VLEYLTSGRYTARELCRAFRKGPYKEADGLPDEHFYAYLGKAIVRELNRRQQLDKYKTIDDVVKLLQERRNIMVITGAGISTSLGIRDFRSKNTGLYAMLKEENDPEVQEPEDVFEINMFDTRPDIFYKYAGGVLPDLKDWTPTHEFIRLLQDKEKLLTNYSQNIDNIESHAGIRKDKYLQCHGSWAMATCRKCKYQIPGEEIFAAVKAQQPAKCKACIKKIAAQKPGMKRKRSSNGSKKRRKAGNDDSDSDGAYDIQTPGIMKPDITFFGEALPDTFFDRLNKQDRDKVDLVIVIGSSMKVEPVCAVPDYLPRHVPHVLINRDVSTRTLAPYRCVLANALAYSTHKL
jgi:NAD-dependent histone deacetylase SIR2